MLNSNGALTSLYVLGTTFKGRKYYERQIRNTDFFQRGGIFKFRLYTHCELSANLYFMNILRPGVSLILSLLWVIQVSIQLAQRLSSNYYLSLFQRLVIIQTEKLQICSLPSNTAKS